MDVMRHETKDAIADGEIVWFWRSNAGAQVREDALSVSRATVANKPVTGKITYKP